ncbi:exonuclease domain-containing protein [Salipaludibacillus sp. CF4.18]|uniref:exonuclease domain-containing protein n=1 Tax=Salipaludibacillus sp. CF4.18 TaxID=3373081 RepID=UPI003EE4714C
MNPMLQWVRQLSGKGSPSHERDPAKIAYMRRLQKDLKQNDYLRTPFEDLTMVVFDIETTGFSPKKGDRILSIGAIKIKGSTVLEEETFYSFIKHDQAPSDTITELTGITLEDLIDAPSQENVLHDFLKYIGNAPLVAHHAKHEIDFMQDLAWQLYKTSFDHRILDTSFLTALIPELRYINVLEECCSFFDIDTSNRHHALQDAKMTAELWSNCIQIVKEQGYTCLRDVYAYIARTR